MSRKKNLFVSLITLLTFAVSVPAFSEGFTKSKIQLPFEPSIQVKNKEVKAKDKTEVSITFKIEPDSYIYKDSLSVNVENISGVKIGKPIFTKAEKKHDKFSNKKKEIYHNGFSIKIPLEITDTAKAGNLELKATVGYQGCSLKKGICFLPQKKPLSINLNLKKK